MNTIANKTTLWNLLQQTAIQIPIIQRDYAQGRIDKEALREQFVGDLKDALDRALKTSDDDVVPIKLDFVYGTKEEPDLFNPLDGQQRLTTLWLLHWYIAYRAEKLHDNDVKETLSRFTYLTRDSSKAFCLKLVSEGEKLPKYQPGQNIADIIMNQTWMFSFWKQDPTVQSMLRMLSGERNNDKKDGLEEYFAETDKQTITKYWRLLTSANTDSCPVVFYQLDLAGIGQSDELYVKMNGRGKPLTDFENFKADIVKHIADHANLESASEGWRQLNDQKYGFANKLDNEWLDYFWAYRLEGIELDDMLFAFINRFFLVKLMQCADKLEASSMDSEQMADRMKRQAYDYFYSYAGEVKINSSNCIRIPYTKHGFSNYNTAFDLISHTDDDGLSVLQELALVLDRVVGYFIYLQQQKHQTKQQAKETMQQLFNCPYYDDSHSFLFVYSCDNKDNAKTTDTRQLSQPQQVAFWAVCHYFSSHTEPLTDDTSLRQWMHIVWNLCSAAEEIQNKQLVITAIRRLAELVADPTDARGAFRRIDYQTTNITNAKSAFEKHICEERAKAMQMLCNGGKYYGINYPKGTMWEDVIADVESNPLFGGNIHALFDCYDTDGNILPREDWTHFDERLANLQRHDNAGLGVDSLKHTLLVGQHRLKFYWFVPTPETKVSNWKPYLYERNHEVARWLETSPDTKCLAAPTDYHLRLLMQTDLLDKVTHPRGIYLAKNSATQCPVLLHHQAGTPYVLFDEQRNETLLEAHDQHIIKLNNTVYTLNNGERVIDGASVSFEYEDLNDGNDIHPIYHFLWRATGELLLERVTTATAENHLMTKHSLTSDLNKKPSNVDSLRTVMNNLISNKGRETEK